MTDLRGRMHAGLERLEPVARRWIRPVLWGVVVLPLVALVAEGVTGALGANPIEAVEHETGEWTIRFLLGSLAVTPLIRATGWGWLIAQRKFLGLAAFWWGLAHFGAYVGLDYFFDWAAIVEDIAEHLWVLAGMAALACLVPLALTSTRGAIRRLGGARWRRLHRLAYLAAVAACVHYFWAVKQDVVEPVLFSVLLAALLAARRWPPRAHGEPTAG
jgi:sulfoxide reductase heme-binding subunit YedZ